MLRMRKAILFTVSQPIGNFDMDGGKVCWHRHTARKSKSWKRKRNFNKLQEEKGDQNGAQELCTTVLSDFTDKANVLQGTDILISQARPVTFWP